MAAPPLTHHDILGVVEPFTRRGRHVDLRASDRIERRIVFKPVEHAAEGAAASALRETMELEHPRDGYFRLARVVALDHGLASRLQVEGHDAGALLARVESIPVRRQLVEGSGFALARSYRLEDSGRARADPESRLILTEATARVAGVKLHLRVPKVGNMPGDLELAAADGTDLALTEDLLAVLGWPWARIVRRGDHWRGTLRLRRSQPARSRDAERKLDRTLAHLARTLAETPALFHARFVRARWRVALRRAMPLLLCLAFLAAIYAARNVEIPENSIGRLVVFHAPTLLLAIFFFILPEVPRFEIPPVPRRPGAASWFESTPAAPLAEGCSATR